MSAADWVMIIGLAVAAFGIRLAGLIAGARIRQSRLAFVLDELPGLIVVALVAASLAGASATAWIAAAIALAVAIPTNHVLVTMAVGVAAFATLTSFWG